MPSPLISAINDLYLNYFVEWHPTLHIQQQQQQKAYKWIIAESALKL